MNKRYARIQRENGSSFPVSAVVTQPIPPFPQGIYNSDKFQPSCQTSAVKDNDITCLDSTQHKCP